MASAAFSETTYLRSNLQMPTVPISPIARPFDRQLFRSDVGQFFLAVPRRHPAQELLFGIVGVELHRRVTQQDMRPAGMIGVDPLVVPAFGQSAVIYAVVEMGDIHARGPCTVRGVERSVFVNTHTAAGTFNDTQRVR